MVAGIFEHLPPNQVHLCCMSALLLASGIGHLDYSAARFAAYYNI